MLGNSASQRGEYSVNVSYEYYLREANIENISMFGAIRGNLKLFDWDVWVAQCLEHLPWAQGVILESWDRVPHWAPCEEPASSSACVSTSSLSVSLMNK